MSLAREYRTILEDLAPDWSDLYFELRLEDEALFDTARLHMAPTQLRRLAGERDLFSFRVSNGSGYGCFPALAEACLAKLDDAGIDGELVLVRTLHGSRHNLTQGPTIAPTSHAAL